MRHTPTYSVDNPTTLELFADLICKTAHARFLRVERVKGHPPQIVFTTADATDESKTFALAVTELSSHEIRKCLETNQQRNQPREERQQEIVSEQPGEITAGKPSLIETSPSGAPVMTGRGVQTVRARIEKQFEMARNSGPTSLMPPKPVADISQRSLLEAIEAAPKPKRSLAETAAPVLRMAEKCFRDVSVQHPHHQDVYFIFVPKKDIDINKLFEKALAVVNRVMPRQKEERRHEMEEE